jgi:hypothetical protein
MGRRHLLDAQIPERRDDLFDLPLRTGAQLPAGKNPRTDRQGFVHGYHAVPGFLQGRVQAVG